MSTLPRTIATLADAQLLRSRVCDVLSGTSGIKAGLVATQVRGLYDDLHSAGLRYFRPAVYLGDEWFSPEGVTAIAVPFYLAHPRLARLERRLMRQVEGGTPRWCRMLLRHEAGHCFEHAYRVSRSPEWRRLFGDRRRRYDPDAAVADLSRADEFVTHLPDGYAQAHPDEDFAETFAVCIDPDSDWRRRYRGRPVVLAKLEYIERLIEKHAAELPRGEDVEHSYVATRMRMTLARYYERRRDEQRRAAKRRTRITGATCR